MNHRDYQLTVAQNTAFLSNLTKFKVVPPHVILHMFKVCLDDFSGTNIENIAMLLEGCGRFLLRSEETRQPFSKMVRCLLPFVPCRHLTFNFDRRLSLCGGSRACSTWTSGSCCSLRTRITRYAYVRTLRCTHVISWE